MMGKSHQDCPNMWKSDLGMLLNNTPISEERVARSLLESYNSVV